MALGDRVLKNLSNARAFKDLKNVSVAQNYYRLTVSCALESDLDSDLLFECWNEYMEFIHKFCKTPKTRLPLIGKNLLNKLEQAYSDVGATDDETEIIERLAAIVDKARKLQEANLAGMHENGGADSHKEKVQPKLGDEATAEEKIRYYLLEALRFSTANDLKSAQNSFRTAFSIALVTGDRDQIMECWNHYYNFIIRDSQNMTGNRDPWIDKQLLKQVNGLLDKLEQNQDSASMPFVRALRGARDIHYSDILYPGGDNVGMVDM